MLGIFDSGSGGLTVLSEIRKKLPLVDVVYLGDIANAPYGGRSKEELGALTLACVKGLLDEGTTNIVSACNSVSASIIWPSASLLSLGPFEIVEMVGPTVQHLGKYKKRIVVVATKATVESGIYQQGFADAGAKTTSIAIPDLAGAIEFGAERKEIVEIVRREVSGKVLESDLLVLGCTHFPLVRDVFEEVLGGVEIFDPALAVAEEVGKRILNEGLGRTRFLITSESENFRERAARIVSDPEIRVIKNAWAGHA